ncbi:hypothetical protein [Heliophilum fasciatum]|uniref:hypothetical protein n=1 Tax=Heliophilum fasciatum TaxID=35700 RepID=UPI001051BE8C|nr:hypothetical protein [Heliophilum fasciatum]
MALRYKKGHEVNASTGLLISVLLRFPEVGTVNFDPTSKTLRFSFLLHPERFHGKMRELTKRITSALDLYHAFDGIEPIIFTIHSRNEEKLLSIEVVRDVVTLGLVEIGLLVDLLRQQASGGLWVEEEQAPLQDDEKEWQEELIANMLDNLKRDNQVQKLFAFREEGRVVVYNQ